MRNWGTPRQDPADNIHPSEWLTHFRDIPKTPQCFLQELEALEAEPYFSELDFRISKQELDSAFRRLNRKASEGPDRVSGELLYAAREIFSPMLLIIFNKAFCNVSHPSIWSENFLKSILKKGDSADPNNYRGIAVGSIVGKLFNLILLSRLEKRIQSTFPISYNQIGFTKGHRTADHIFVLKTIVSSNRSSRMEETFCGFYRLSKIIRSN